ncbi:MAG: metal-sensitive transcriptional regulator [Micavibrio sp.]
MPDCKTDHSSTQPCHEADLPRLNRITGQLNGVKKMIEEKRYCPDILTQLRAVRAAVKGLEASILERHLGHCINESLKGANETAIKEKVEELKELFKRYDD